MRTTLTKFISITMILTFFIISVELFAKGKPMNSWFKNPPFQKLVIKHFKSIEEPIVVRSIEISETKTIEDLTKRIQLIPANGDKFKSFGGSTSWISLVFSNSKGTEMIEIYRDRFKTPSTGFNTELSPVEADLYRDINLLLDSKKTKGK